MKFQSVLALVEILGLQVILFGAFGGESASIASQPPPPTFSPPVQSSIRSNQWSIEDDNIQSQDQRSRLLRDNSGLDNNDGDDGFLGFLVEEEQQHQQEDKKIEEEKVVKDDDIQVLNDLIFGASSSRDAPITSPFHKDDIAAENPSISKRINGGKQVPSRKDRGDSQRTNVKVQRRRNAKKSNAHQKYSAKKTQHRNKGKTLRKLLTENETIVPGDMDGEQSHIFGSSPRPSPHEHNQEQEWKQNEIGQKQRKRAQHRKQTTTSRISSFEAETLSANLVHSTSQILSSILRGNEAGHIPADIYGQTLHQEIAVAATATQNPDSIRNNSLPTDTENPIYDNDEGTFPSGTATNTPITSESFSSSFIHQQYHQEETDTLAVSMQSALSTFPDPKSASQKLYGGAQYHRTLRTFHHLILAMPLQPTDADELALLLQGISPGDVAHNGADLLRIVATLASKKMEHMVEFLLKEMAKRVEYVFERMWEVVEYTMLVRGDTEGSYGLRSSRSIGVFGGLGVDGNPATFTRSGSTNLDSNPNKSHGGESLDAAAAEINIQARRRDSMERQLKDFMKQSYLKFVSQKVKATYELAQEDVEALLRFVSWELAFGDKGRGVGRSKIIRKGEDEERRDSMENIHEFVNSNENDAADDQRQGKNNRKKRNFHAAWRSQPSRKEETNDRPISQDDTDVDIAEYGFDDYDVDIDDDGDIESNEEELGDLVGGVLNQGTYPHDSSQEYDKSVESPVNGLDPEMNKILSVIIRSIQNPSSTQHQFSTPMHGGTLTVSTTHAAIETLVHYVTNRWRLDISQMVMGKYNSFCLLSFHEEFAAFLRREMELHLKNMEF